MAVTAVLDADDWTAGAGRRGVVGQGIAPNGLIDLARLLAAVGIVFFHLGPPGTVGSVIGYAALPFFLMLMLVLAVPAAERTDRGRFARDRMRRLLIPWVIWSAIYGGLKLVELALTGRPWQSEFAPWMIWTGPALHLWFLPYALVASLIVHGLIQAILTGPLRHLPPRRIEAGLLLAAIGALGLAQVPHLPTPLAQWVHVLPALMIGLIFAVVHPRRGHPLTPAAAGLAVCALGWLMGWQAGLPQLAIASLALAACLMLRMPTTPWTARVGAAALGVYLIHPLVGSVLMRGLGLAENSLALGLTTAALALMLALTPWVIRDSGQRPRTA
jgi:peptidoglycan/LPS O-acetylase OafA/YrhL